MKPLLLPHLGLGDAIILAGAAVALVHKHGGIIFPCWPRNEVSVRSFFLDYPEVEIILIDSEQAMLEMARIHPAPVYRAGIYHSENLPDEPFDVWMYRTLGVDFEASWELCPLQKASEKVKQIPFMVPPLPVIHEDWNRCYIMREDLLPKESHPVMFLGPSVLAWADRLKIAPEIHVVNSSYLHLADRLETSGKLIFHRYARARDEAVRDLPRLRKQWTIVA